MRFEPPRACSLRAAWAAAALARRVLTPRVNSLLLPRTRRPDSSSPRQTPTPRGASGVGACCNAAHSERAAPAVRKPSRPSRAPPRARQHCLEGSCLHSSKKWECGQQARLGGLWARPRKSPTAASAGRQIFLFRLARAAPLQTATPPVLPLHGSIPRSTTVLGWRRGSGTAESQVEVLLSRLSAFWSRCLSALASSVVAALEPPPAPYSSRPRAPALPPVCVCLRCAALEA